MSSVSCGHYHTVAVSAAGEVWAWGESAYGALGIPITSNQSNVYEPTHVRIKIQGQGHSSMSDIMQPQDSIAIV